MKYELPKKFPDFVGPSVDEVPGKDKNTSEVTFLYCWISHWLGPRGTSRAVEQNTNSGSKHLEPVQGACYKGNSCRITQSGVVLFKIF
jgi:hypothetical protein